MGIFSQRSPGSIADRVSSEIRRARESFTTGLDRARAFTEPAGRAMFDNMYRRGEELVAGSEGLVLTQARATNSQVDIARFVLNPDAPGARDRMIEGEKFLAQLPVDVAAGTLQGVTDRLKRIGAAGWIAIDGDRMQQASAAIADCAANPGQPEVRKKLQGAFRELTRPQLVRVTDQGEFTQVMNAYVDLVLDVPQLVLDLEQFRGIGRGFRKTTVPNRPASPRGPNARIQDPLVDPMAPTQPDLPASPLARTMPPAGGGSRGRLSSAEHDAVMKEMIDLDRAGRAYGPDGRPTPRYGELLRKTKRHVDAYDPFEPGVPRTRGAGPDASIGDPAVDAQAPTARSFPRSRLAQTRSPLASTGHGFAGQAKNLTRPLHQQISRLAQTGSSRASTVRGFARQAKNLTRPLQQQISRLAQTGSPRASTGRGLAHHAMNLTGPLLQKAAQVKQIQPGPTRERVTRLARQATDRARPSLLKMTKLPRIQPQFTEHTVRRGDTLWGIAKANYGSGAKYHRIARANPHIKNPNLIRPGQVIKIPQPRFGKR